MNAENKMFGYNISSDFEKMVGIVIANNIKEAKDIIKKAFRLNSVRDEDFTEIQFNLNGICELYYGC